MNYRLTLALAIAASGCADPPPTVDAGFDGYDGPCLGIAYPSCVDPLTCENFGRADCVGEGFFVCDRGEIGGASPCVPAPDAGADAPDMVTDPCMRTEPVDCVDAFTCERAGEAACESDGLDATYSCPMGQVVDDGSCEPPGSCERNDECILAANTCCRVCGEPTIDEVQSIHRDGARELLDRLCGDPGPPCPGCATFPNPNLVPTCNATECVAVDLGDTTLQACEVDDDCAMRVTGCCECGGDTTPEALLALASVSIPDYLALVCESDTGCDDCLPDYPSDREPFCDAGSCNIRVLAD